MNAKAKALTVEKIVDNKEQNELKDLKQQIESLAAIVKSAMVGSVKPNVMEGVSSPKKREVLGHLSTGSVSRVTPEKGRDF